jgi:C4-dicarboxylate transporter DctM subunit
MIFVMFILMFVLFFLMVPVAVSLGLASAVAAIGLNFPIGNIAQKFLMGLNSFTLLAVPFFILAGTLMAESGISDRIIDFVSSMVGHHRGGLAVVMIFTCMVFGALTGSPSATISAIGSIMIPHMVKRGYEIRFTAATQAASANLADLIPPSIGMILYGVATNTSIRDLFMAGLVPGILLGCIFAVYANRRCIKLGIQGEPRQSWPQRWACFKKSIWALLMPCIILGGIYGGFFTATESAAVAVLYACFVSLFVYRTLNLRSMFRVFIKAGINVAIIMLILSTANLFAYILTYMQIPNLAAEWFVSIAHNKYIFLLIVNLFLLVVGMFFDPGPGVIILAPILAPAATALGIDIVHFGAIMTMNFCVGACTPPFAVNLFVSSQVSGIKFEEIVKPILPYIAIMIAALFLISYVPQISLLLV